MASALTMDNDNAAPCVMVIHPKNQSTDQLPSLGDFAAEETSTSIRNSKGNFFFEKALLLPRNC